MNYEEEDSMLTPCHECGTIFDLHDGLMHPRTRKTTICENCAERIQKEVKVEEEIEELLIAISDAKVTIEESEKRLAELGYIKS